MSQHLPRKFQYSQRIKIQHLLGTWGCCLVAIFLAAWLLWSNYPPRDAIGWVILCLPFAGLLAILGANDWFCMSTYILSETEITQVLPFGKTIAIRWKDVRMIVPCELGIRGPTPAKSATRGLWKYRALVSTQGQFIVVSNDIEQREEFEKIVVSFTGDSSIRWTKSAPSKSAKELEDVNK